MNLYLDIPEAPLEGPDRVVSIGTFDGVHQGHQNLVGRTVAKARESGRLSLLFTFHPLPETVLSPASAPPTLMSIDERIAALKSLGPDEILVVQPRRELLGLPADLFAEHLLMRRLRVTGVVGGQGFRFGKDRTGDAALLQRLGLEVEALPPTLVGGEVVSSTRIRGLLRDRRPAEAARLLTRPYALTGTVVRGREVGRTLGFPTANLRPAEGRLVPGSGVYACQAELLSPAADPAVEGARLLGSASPSLGSYRAVVNIGTRPTFDSEAPTQTVEAHLLGFSADLYGAPLRLHFLGYLREERKFSSLDELVSQIRRDRDAAERLEDPGRGSGRLESERAA